MKKKKCISRFLQLKIFVKISIRKSKQTSMVEKIRDILLFIILVARALVVSANAFGLGIFFVFLLFLSSNREHCYSTWFTIVPGVGDWVCVRIVIHFWSFTVLAIMCTNSLRFLPSVKKLGVSMFMSCPFFAWMIKEKRKSYIVHFWIIAHDMSFS